MEKKLRHSRQRELIYQYLLSTEEHPSAEMVYHALSGKIENLSLGTVYRNLKLLEQLGKVRRITTPGNVERYDARCFEHAHLVCTGCGGISDLAELDVQTAKDKVSASIGSNVEWLELCVGGLCAACRQKA